MSEHRFLTEYELKCLREYYFDPDNEVEKNLTEAGFKQWYEDLDWYRVDEIVGSSDDSSDYDDTYDDDGISSDAI